MEKSQFELARLKICEQCNFNKIDYLARTSEIARKDGIFRVVCFGIF